MQYYDKFGTFLKQHAQIKIGILFVMQNNFASNIIN